MWVEQVAQWMAGCFGTVAGLGVRGMVVLVLAGLMLVGMRRASAASRHAIWTAGLMGAVVLPVIALLLPSWRVLPRMVERGQTTVAVSVPEGPVVRPNPVETGAWAGSEPAAVADVSKPEVRGMPAVRRPALSAVQWAKGGAVLVWVAGVMVLALRLVLGQVALMRLGRRARRVEDGELLEQWRWAKEQMGVGRGIELLLGNREVPMTWGVWRKRVLLPGEAGAWDRARVRMVLLHELAHVRRRDCLMQILAQAACAVRWVDPLVWLAWREIQRERERACDDRVLGAGLKASAYADELVQIAARFERRGHAAAVAMARHSNMKERLMAILDTTRNRKGLTAGAVVALTMLGGMAVGVGVLRAAEGQKPATGDTQRPTKVEATTQPAQKPHAPQGTSDVAQHLELALDSPLPEIRLDNAAFDTVITKLSDVTGTNIFVDWRALAAASIDRNAPVTIHLRNVKFSKVLQTVLDSVGSDPTNRLIYRTDEGVITITTTDYASGTSTAVAPADLDADYLPAVEVKLTDCAGPDMVYAASGANYDIRNVRGDSFLSLKTGKPVHLPEMTRGTMDGMVRDAGAEVVADNGLLIGVDDQLRFMEVSQPVSASVFESTWRAGQALDRVFYSEWDKMPKWCLFKTRSGQAGAMQLVRQEADGSLVLNYRFLKGRDNAQVHETPWASARGREMRAIANAYAVWAEQHQGQYPATLEEVKDKLPGVDLKKYRYFRPQPPQGTPMPGAPIGGMPPGMMGGMPPGMMGAPAPVAVLFEAEPAFEQGELVGMIDGHVEFEQQKAQLDRYKAQAAKGAAE